MNKHTMENELEIIENSVLYIQISCAQFTPVKEDHSPNQLPLHPRHLRRSAQLSSAQLSRRQAPLRLQGVARDRWPAKNKRKIKRRLCVCVCCVLIHTPLDYTTATKLL